MFGKRKAESPLEPELPITPMLDMSFQILFFFVMIYHPSALEVQLDLNLPGRGPIVDPPPGKPLGPLETAEKAGAAEQMAEV